jgi:hypothetical protein
MLAFLDFEDGVVSSDFLGELEVLDASSLAVVAGVVVVVAVVVVDAVSEVAG